MAGAGGVTRRLTPSGEIRTRRSDSSDDDGGGGRHSDQHDQVAGGGGRDFVGEVPRRW